MLQTQTWAARYLPAQRKHPVLLWEAEWIAKGLLSPKGVFPTLLARGREVAGNNYPSSPLLFWA